MKICQINCVYGNGSTGKIVRDIHMSLIDHNIESFVIVPCLREDDKNVFSVSNTILSYITAIYRRTFGRQFDGGIIQTLRIIKILNKEKPDIVHLHCINGNNINIYKLLNFLSNNHIKTIMTLHAEYPYTGGCGHAFECYKWLDGCHNCKQLREGTKSYFIDGTKHTWISQNECYKKFEETNLYIVAVSPWLLNRAELSPMLKKFNKCVIMNGCNTKIFHYTRSNFWRKKFNIPQNRKIVLFVSSYFTNDEYDLKGGKFVCKIAEELKGHDCIFIVVSNYNDVKRVPSNMIFAGKITDQTKLAQLYSEADLTLLTSRKETFSMVLAESLCCGTQVVGFKAGGPESIALNQYTTFFDYGDIRSLEKYIINYNIFNNKKEIISKNSILVYSLDNMLNKYIELYNSFLEY